MTEAQAHLLLIFVGIIAVAALIQFIALAAMGVALARFFADAKTLVDEAKGKFYPMAETIHRLATTTEGIVDDAAPKVRRITSNIADTSDVYRAKVGQIDTFITETTTKARKQRDRVDAAATHLMDRTEEITTSVQNGFMAPFRQVAGIIGGLRAGIETLIRSEQEPTTPRVPKPRAFQGDNIYTGLEDDYHA